MRLLTRNRVSALVSACGLSLLSATSGWSQTLTWLGVPSGFDASEAMDVSDDGRVVVGYALRAGGVYIAFRWTAQTGFLNLGTLGGTDSRALGVSADGRVVVGYSRNATSAPRAFRWTEETGMQDLGTLSGGWQSRANDVSADGRVIVGYSSIERSYDILIPFRWTEETGMQSPGNMFEYCSAWCISADGQVVGINCFGSSMFLWTEQGDIRRLNRTGHLKGLSADGSIAIGETASFPSSGWRAFRWTAATGFNRIGTLGGSGNRSQPWDISADGRVIVGWAWGARDQERAFRWTAECGMQDLNNIYEELLLPSNSILYRAHAVSADGRYIVGTGWNGNTGRTEAFLLDTGTVPCVSLGDINGDRVVNDADLLILLFNFGTQCP